MPQSYTCLHYHVIFSTKHREPAIAPAVRGRLYDYIGGVVRGEGGVLLAAGGVADHVHLLVRLAQQPAVADAVRALKAGSSGWVRDTFPGASWPGWQTGYGAFTVSYSQLRGVERYIDGQEEHHRATSFQDEYRAFLKRHGIAFDERYLWD